MNALVRGLTPASGGGVVTAMGSVLDDGAMEDVESMRAMRGPRAVSPLAGRPPTRFWLGAMTPHGTPSPGLVRGSPTAKSPGESTLVHYSAMPVRTVIERGPKGKRSVAFSLD